LQSPCSVVGSPSRRQYDSRVGALTVRVLGELWVDGVEMRSLADRKARLVLRLLALARGRSIPTAALAEALWGDSGPQKPADQIAVLVSRLRKALGRDTIEYGDHGYRLVYAWLDLDELGTVIREAERRRDAGNVSGAVAASRVALSLIRGPVPDPPSDIDWAGADVEAATRLVRRARRIAAAAMLDAGEWPDALDLAATDLHADPYDEEAVRLVMRAHVAAGRPSAALAAYAVLRETLADELGADPAPETTELNASVLRGDADVVRPSASAPEPGLVGRRTELDQLDALADAIGDNPVRVVSVVGEAGIGKTTLLQAWTRRRAARGDIVLTGTCGALDDAAPLDVVLGAIAEHLRRSPDPDALLGEDRAVLAPLLGASLDDRPGTRHGPDPVLGPATLYAAITAVLDRIAGEQGAILAVDDAHLAGPALADWAAFAVRRPARLLVVAAARAAEGTPIPASTTLTIQPLDLAETAELVGSQRADDLHSRTGGNPLFLSELASTDPADDAVPLSLVSVVEARCNQLGPAAEALRAAAVLGTELDIDLLATVLGRSSLEVLADAELAEDRGLLVERAGRHAFRHELVRSALASGARAGRAALLHREASRILSRRSTSDPVEVAEHARLGGDLELAAQSLHVAAARAAERFDHETAEALLDRSLALHPTDTTLLERARVRVRRGHYAAAQTDVAAAAEEGAEGWEIAAWASYFDRRFDDAIRFSRDGELGTERQEIRARCLTVGGRTLHARGDLVGAETQLSAAVGAAVGPDRVTAAAWLGVLRAHCSQHDQALELLGPVTQPGAGAELTSATLHAFLFTGHVFALAGRTAEALVALGRYTEEVERRQVPRFAGRGVNMSGWVLRNVGAQPAAVDAHEEALDLAVGQGMNEMRIAALEDLAEEQLRLGEAAAASRLLDEAEGLFVGDLVFGWRLALKLAVLRTRLALLTEHPEQALASAQDLRATADALGVPRYGSVARVLVHQARAALGEPADLPAVVRDLAAVEHTVQLESWWWAGETGSLLGADSLVDRAETLAAELARSSGPHADALRADADRRLAGWRLRTR